MQPAYQVQGSGGLSFTMRYCLCEIGFLNTGKARSSFLDRSCSGRIGFRHIRGAEREKMKSATRVSVE
jgi:hypothetical protein